MKKYAEKKGLFKRYLALALMAALLLTGCAQQSQTPTLQIPVATEQPTDVAPAQQSGQAFFRHTGCFPPCLLRKSAMPTTVPVRRASSAAHAIIWLSTDS